MKVLTITTQYANNMGALLQCYALSEFLNSQKDIDCKVIQYFPEGAEKSWVYFRKNNTFREFLQNVYKFFRVDLYYVNCRKNRFMRKFIDKYIPLTSEVYNSRDEILNNPPFADAYIAGSDQIWNFKYRMDFTFFLEFATKFLDSKRIAYAPSVADPWTDAQCKRIQPILKNFHALSVRELENVEQVRQLVNLEVFHVADPVFLLSRGCWDKILRKPAIKEPYIFCYFLSVSDLAVKAVEKLRKLTGYKVVHLNLNTLDKFHSDYNIRVSDPCDFIGYISQATFVCTNSFHCSAFSILYKRNFCFVPKHMANSRVKGLQDVFQLGNVILSEDKVHDLQLGDLTIDYQNGERSGNEFIEKSKEFLLNSLYEGI